MSYFEHDQLVRELGRQLVRIQDLERALANLEQRQDQDDDRLTTIELALGPTTGPSVN